MGTANNPKPPQYSDLAGPAEISDDGRFALVEFVAKDYPTPANVWNAKTPPIKTPSQNPSASA